jgi:hypothetical protein
MSAIKKALLDALPKNCTGELMRPTPITTPTVLVNKQSRTRVVIARESGIRLEAIK